MLKNMSSYVKNDGKLATSQPEIINRLLTTVLNVSCGIGSISKNTISSKCIEYTFWFLPNQPIVILRYEGCFKSVYVANVKTHRNAYTNLGVVEDLLTVVQNILAGIASVSINCLDGNYTELKIDALESQPTVIILYELHGKHSNQENRVYCDSQVLDEKYRLFTDNGNALPEINAINKKNVNLQSGSFQENDDQVNCYQSNKRHYPVVVKKELPELLKVLDCNDSSRESNKQQDFSLKISSHVKNENPQINTQFMFIKSFDTKAGNLSSNHKLFDKSSFSDCERKHLLRCSENARKKDLPNTYLESEIVNCRETNLNREFINKKTDLQSVTCDHNDNFTAEGYDSSEQCYNEKQVSNQGKVNFTKHGGIENTPMKNILSCVQAVYSESSSDTTVVDMEIDDGKEMLTKYQKIVYDYSKARKLFKCKHCDKRFDNLWDTKKHEKLHVCSYCSQIFEHSSSRSKHEKTHMDEITYPCSYCEKTFTSKFRKRSHEKTHVKEQDVST